LPVRLRYYTDPACSASWAAEPALRRLQLEFGDEVRITYVMGGLSRQYEGDQSRLVIEWLDAAERSGMPVDPRAWNTPGAIGSTFPACMAFKAAAEQGPEAAERYLRALREGIMCRRRKLDGLEALMEEARAAGLDVERFRVDVGSHAIVEAFGADLEETRGVPDAARERGLVAQAPSGERLALPALRFLPDGADSPGTEPARPAGPGTESVQPVGDGTERWCGANDGYEGWREAALAAGAVPASGALPSVVAALERFGSLAAAEVSGVCDLPGPRAHAELWRLATEWRVRPQRFLTGELWTLA
jgi:predicted DsbA family dithiol-disulfide isomerase